MILHYIRREKAYFKDILFLFDDCNANHLTKAFENVIISSVNTQEFKIIITFCNEGKKMKFVGFF